MDLLGFKAPSARLFTQGMITRDGAKMSKSKGNDISPRDYVERYGADTARCYILYIGPPDQDADWSDTGVEGRFRFLSRLWTVATETAEQTGASEGPDGEPTAVLRKAHSAIQQVTVDLGRRFAFNAAIARIAELVNDVYRHRD